MKLNFVSFFLLQTAHGDIVKAREEKSGKTPSLSHLAVQKVKPGEPRHDKITQSLMKFMASSYMPISTVENQAFKDFVKELNPG